MRIRWSRSALDQGCHAVQDQIETTLEVLLKIASESAGGGSKGRVLVAGDDVLGTTQRKYSDRRTNRTPRRLSLGSAESIPSAVPPSGRFMCARMIEPGSLLSIE